VRLGRQQSLVSLISYGVSLLAMTALLPILVRVLGPKHYGAWVLTGGIVNYVNLVDFGMSLTIARFVALGYGRDRRDAEQAIGVGMAFVAFIGALLVLVLFPLAGSWERFLDVPGSAFALRAGACSLVAILLSKVLQSALEGAGKVALSRALQAIGTVSFAACGATIVFVTSRKLEALSLVLVANSLAILAAYAVFLTREWGWRIPVGRPTRSAWRRVLAYAMTMQTGSIIALSTDPISRLLLAATSGPAAVAPLDIALRTTSQWFGAGLAFTRPVLPTLGHLSHDEEAAARRADELWKRFLGVGIAAGAFAAIVAYFIFPTLFGSIGDRAGALAAVSMLLWIPAVVATIPYVYVVLYGSARNIFSIQLLTSGAGICLTLALIWSIGAWAPVIGLGTGAILGAGLTLRIARKRAGQFKLFEFSGISAGTVVATVAASAAAAVAFLLPVPLLVRCAAAVIGWFMVSLPQLRNLLRTL
jgi:O-antigen/teichoic acid export membrane protein